MIRFLRTGMLPVTDGQVPCPIRGTCDAERCLSCRYLDAMTRTSTPSIECRAAALADSPADQALVFVAGL